MGTENEKDKTAWPWTREFLSTFRHSDEFHFATTFLRAPPVQNAEIFTIKSILLETTTEEYLMDELQPALVNDNLNTVYFTLFWTSDEGPFKTGNKIKPPRIVSDPTANLTLSCPGGLPLTSKNRLAFDRVKHQSSVWTRKELNCSTHW